MHHGHIKTKQEGGFAFCLMPMHEEAVLGPGPDFPASGPLGREDGDFINRISAFIKEIPQSSLASSTK